MPRSEDEITMKTGNHQISLFSGALYEVDNENYTEAIYYLTARRA
jgi:hypothetical protein